MTPSELVQVPVRGGELTVGRWGSGDRVVVAVHGVTANHTSWMRTAELLDGYTVVAPDLRGRGGSARLPGPWGMSTHADDCVAILDHLGVERAVFAGHSMGGFVVAKAAERHPDRVAALVLVDGGVPLEIQWPEGLDLEAKVQAVIGPAMQRLDMTWPDLDAYLDFWRPHPAVGESWNAYTEAYLAYDVEETDGVVRSKVSKEAILFDSRETLDDETAATSILRIDVPTQLLWAPRGLMNQVPGLYPPDQVERIERELPHVTARLVEDVNHYSLAFAANGAAALAEAIVKAATDA